MDESLQTRLVQLHIQDPDVPDCFPARNPIDVYRIHLANALSEVTGVQPKAIFPLLQRTATLDKGDLVLAVPALRIKGEKPDVLTSRWADQVCRTMALHAKQARIDAANSLI
jgi:arginyl-tRNA synthetase